MKALLKRLGELPGGAEPYNTDPLKIFDAVVKQKQGGLFLDPGAYAGYATGSMELGTARIAFNRIDSGPFSAWMNGGTGLHEITHIGRKTGYTNNHTAMAQAAYDVATAQKLQGDLGRRAPDNPPGGDWREWKKREAAASQSFEGIFFNACRKR